MGWGWGAGVQSSSSFQSGIFQDGVCRNSPRPAQMLGSVGTESWTATPSGVSRSAWGWLTETEESCLALAVPARVEAAHVLTEESPVGEALLGAVRPSWVLQVNHGRRRASHPSHSAPYLAPGGVAGGLALPSSHLWPRLGHFRA